MTTASRVDPLLHHLLLFIIVEFREAILLNASELPVNIGICQAF